MSKIQFSILLVDKGDYIVDDLFSLLTTIFSDVWICTNQTDALVEYKKYKNDTNKYYDAVVVSDKIEFENIALSMLKMHPIQQFYTLNKKNLSKNTKVEKVSERLDMLRRLIHKSLLAKESVDKLNEVNKLTRLNSEFLNLREKNKIFKSVFDNVKTPILIIENRQFIECNKEAVKVLKCDSKEKLLNIHPSKISPNKQPDGQDSFKKAEEMMALCEKNGTHQFKWLHLCTDNEEFFAEVTLSKIDLEDRELIHVSWKNINVQLLHEKELEKEQKKKNGVLKQLQQYKKSIDEISIVSRTNKYGIITYVNEKFCLLSGYSKKELLGSPHSIVRHPSNDSAIFRGMWKMLLNKEVWHGILHNLKKNGESYYVRSSIFPLLDEEGEIEEFVAIREDLTESIVSYQKLESDHIRTQVILDEQDSKIALFNENFSIEHLNLAFLTFIDVKDKFDFFKRFKGIYELFIKEEGYFSTSLEDKKWIHHYISSIESNKVKIRTNRGKNEIFQLNIKHFILEEKIFYLLTLANITQLEEARIEAENAKQAERSFLAKMSHEIRTPLNAIVGFNELLKDTSLQSEQQQYVNMIENSSNHLIHIINDILDLSKIGANHMQLDPTESNIHLRTIESFEAMNQLALKKHIKYKVKISPIISECLIVDLNRLRQVLYNVASNAIKFTPEYGEIIAEVKLLEEDKKVHVQHLEFSIEDNGVGIDENRLKDVFKEFEQEDSGISRKYGGSGLGLSISSKLLKLMGSNLCVESQKGKGSRFYFDLVLKYIPQSTLLKDRLQGKHISLIQSEEVEFYQAQEYLNSLEIPFNIVEKDIKQFSKDDIVIIFTLNIAFDILIKDSTFACIIINKWAKQISPSDNIYPLDSFLECHSTLYGTLTFIQEHRSNKKEKIERYSKKSILVAEDYSVNAELLEVMLKKYEVDVDVAINGKEVLQKLEQKSYDLILMDIDMPILDGIKATVQIREKGDDTTIVACTANVMKQERKRCLTAGMQDILLKPIKRSSLDEILNTYLIDTPVNAQEISVYNYFENAAQSLELPLEIILTLVEKYLIALETSIEELIEADKNSDFETLYAIGHKLKGSSGTLCFTNVADEAKEIEIMAKNKIKLDNQIKNIQNQKALISKELNSIKDGH